MNFREGMRRFGILLGAAGGVIGGFLAFVPDFGNAPGVWNNLTAHRRFEATLILPTVQKAAKGIATGAPLSDADIAAFDARTPKAAWQSAPRVLSDADIAAFDATGKADRLTKNAPATGFIPPPVSSDQGPVRLPPGAKLLPDLSQYGTVSGAPANAWVPVDDNGGLTIVGTNALLKDNRDGIDSIQFRNKRVVAIGFTTGEWVYRTEAPKFSAYLALLAFPAFGFLLPWAAVRLVTWVGTGFFASKSG